MRAAILTGLVAFAVSALAKCTDKTQQYNAIPGFANSNGCVPNGYYQTQDLGNTTPDQVQSRCQQFCASDSACEAFVGEYWYSPNGLYSGQCFYYHPGSVPASPQQCHDHPTNLIAQRKDRTPACFASSSQAATAYCSSYLRIGTVTSYTSTYVPVLRATTSTTSTGTSIISTTTTTTFTQTSSSSTETDTITSITTLTSDVPSMLSRRAASTIPAPACLSSRSAPASRISSACSCLSIAKTTVYKVTTAKPTSTSTTSIIRTTLTISTTSTSISSTTLRAPTSTVFTTTTTTAVTLTTGSGCAAACPSQLSANSVSASAACSNFVVTSTFTFTPTDTVTSTSFTSTTSTSLATLSTLTIELISQTTTISSITSTLTFTSTYSTSYTTYNVTVNPTISTFSSFSTASTASTASTSSTSSSSSTPLKLMRHKRSTSLVITQTQQSIPTYASYCYDTTSFVSACSCLGVTPQTTVVTVTAATDATSSVSTQTTQIIVFQTTATAVSTSQTTLESSFTIGTTSTTTTATVSSAVATLPAQSFYLRILDQVHDSDDGTLAHYVYTPGDNDVIQVLRYSTRPERPVAVCQLNPGQQLYCNNYLIGEGAATEGGYLVVGVDIHELNAPIYYYTPFTGCSISASPQNILSCNANSAGDSFFHSITYANLHWDFLANHGSDFVPITLQAVPIPP